MTQKLRHECSLPISSVGDKYLVTYARRNESIIPISHAIVSVKQCVTPDICARKIRIKLNPTLGLSLKIYTQAIY